MSSEDKNKILEAVGDPHPHIPRLPDLSLTPRGRVIKSALDPFFMDYPPINPIPTSDADKPTVRAPKLADIGIYPSPKPLIEKVEDRVQKILKEYGEKGITNTELSKEMKISKSLSRRYLKILQEQGYAKVIGYEEDSATGRKIERFAYIEKNN